MIRGQDGHPIEPANREEGPQDELGADEVDNVRAHLREDLHQGEHREGIGQLRFFVHRRGEGRELDDRDPLVGIGGLLVGAEHRHLVAQPLQVREQVAHSQRHPVHLRVEGRGEDEHSEAMRKKKVRAKMSQDEPRRARIGKVIGERCDDEIRMMRGSLSLNL